MNFKQGQVVKVYWDGPVQVKVVAVDGDQITIQRGSGTACNDVATVQKQALANMVRA